MLRGAPIQEGGRQGELGGKAIQAVLVGTPCLAIGIRHRDHDGGDFHATEGGALAVKARNGLIVLGRGLGEGQEHRPVADLLSAMTATDGCWLDDRSEVLSGGTRRWLAG